MRAPYERRKCAAFNSRSRKGRRLIRVKDKEWCFVRNSGGTVDLFHPEVCMMRFIFLKGCFYNEMDGS